MGNSVFGSHVKRLRENYGLTMEKFAERVGVKKSNVSMWENSGVVPRYDTLLKISEEFKISIDQLLGNDETESAEENHTLHYIQRNLKKLNDLDLQKAETILKSVFLEIFEDEEEEDDDF